MSTRVFRIAGIAVVASIVLAATILIAAMIVQSLRNGIEKRSVSQLRSVATAIESYAVDNNAGESFHVTDDPAPVHGLQRATRREVATEHMRTLAEALDCFREDTGAYPQEAEEIWPVTEEWGETLQEWYRERISWPLLDPWARPYLYWSDGEVFLLASTGPDGIAAADLEGYVAARMGSDRDGPMMIFDDDVLYFAAAPTPGGGPEDAVWHSIPDPGYGGQGSPCKRPDGRGPRGPDPKPRFTQWPEGSCI